MLMTSRVVVTTMSPRHGVELVKANDEGRAAPSKVVHDWANDNDDIPSRSDLNCGFRTKQAGTLGLTLVKLCAAGHGGSQCAARMLFQDHLCRLRRVSRQRLTGGNSGPMRLFARSPFCGAKAPAAVVMSTLRGGGSLTTVR